MNEKINLCEILKDCPKGTKLYSPLFGYCTLIDVTDTFVRVNYREKKWVVNKDATIPFLGADSIEPLLFPSKEKRDWSKFKVKKPKFDPKTLNPFDRVLVLNYSYGWCCDVFSHYESENKDGGVVSGGFFYSKVIPYNEETKHLVGTSDEAPEYYRHWEE